MHRHMNDDYSDWKNKPTQEELANMSEKKHSPLPWGYEEFVDSSDFRKVYYDITHLNHRVICSLPHDIRYPDRATAHFIVKCCNSYYENKAKAELFDELVAICKRVISDHDSVSTNDDMSMEWMDDMQAALTKAEQLGKGV